MVTHTSATVREETPHATETTRVTISDAVKRRAQSVINDRSIDPRWRSVIRYALETNDPWLADLVRRADTPEKSSTRSTFLNQTKPSERFGEEKIAALAKMICRGSDGSASALLVLMATLETPQNSKYLQT